MPGHAMLGYAMPGYARLGYARLRKVSPGSGKAGLRSI